jgi:DNA-binding response OmpR family regulator
VDTAADAATALSLLHTAPPDLVLLDLGLPDEDGLSLLARLRAVGQGVPVLVVTARGDLDERVRGLDAGADDYLAKPFAMAELLARVRALLRRPGPYQEETLTVGRVTLDLRQQTASVGGELLTLGRREYQLLELLARRSGRTVPRDAIDAALYSAEEAVTPNAVEAAMSRLRRQLAASEAGIDIHTVRGVGYLLETGA